ncbi:MAG: tRNA epoxyqueuosine(34) reductase QueG [Planctomycetota bacterium]
MSLSQDIKHKTIELGFDLVGITDASPIDAEQAEIFADWLKSGFAGQMHYMHRNLEKRLDPAKLLENAQSVIVVGLNYTPPGQTPTQPAEPSGKVAGYAQFEDYHPFMKERLRRLVDFMRSHVDAGFNFRICVDSAPVAERALAVRTGLGFVGRNHMLINPRLGCQMFLAEIITDLKLQPDEPIAGDCAGCTECIGACPTGALRDDGRFDAGKCINYLTIEYKGPIPPDLAEKMSDRVFGCDECVLVCPYQENAPACRTAQFRFYSDRARLDLREVLALTAEAFEARFAGSPIERAGLDGLRRNAEICLANVTRRP